MFNQFGGTIYDVGMYDSEDTAYYLDLGYKVAAVEANPNLVFRAEKRFAEASATGQLILENQAIGETYGELVLHLSGEDLGSSSILESRVEHRLPIDSVKVKSIPILDLFAKHGMPHFMKVDIEGYDRFCILPLTQNVRPHFVSFEMGEDAEELIIHLQNIGYTKYKIISQLTFRELANVRCLQDRVALRLRKTFDLGDPQFVQRAGRKFRCGHSSGPIPPLTDGHWFCASDTLKRLREYVETPTFWGWFDLVAAID